MLMRRGNGSGDGGEEEEGEGETERLAMGQICKRTDVRVLRSERDGGMGGDDGCLGGEWNRKGAGGVEGGEVVMFPGIVHLT